MLSLQDALAGIALPAAVAGVLLLVLGRLAGGRGWAAAIAIGCGQLAGHVGVRGWRGWQPKESTDWIAVGAAAGLVAGVFGLTRHGPFALRLLLRWLTALGAAWLIAGRSLANRGDATEVLGRMALVAAGAALGWSLLESRRYAGGDRPAAASPLLLTVAAGCAALAIGLSGSVLLARLAGVLAAALGAAWVVTALRLAPPLLPGVAPVVALALLGLLLAASVHARLPVVAALLLAGAAVVPPPRASAGPDASGGGSGLGSLLLATLLGGAAVGLAWKASPPLDF